MISCLCSTLWAKSIVEAKLAKKAEVQLSYAIGVAKLISILLTPLALAISQNNLRELIIRILSGLEEVKNLFKKSTKKMCGEFFRKTGSMDILVEMI